MVTSKNSAVSKEVTALAKGSQEDITILEKQSGASVFSVLRNGEIVSLTRDELVRNHSEAYLNYLMDVTFGRIL
jgi:hypothetical protein